MPTEVTIGTENYELFGGTGNDTLNGDDVLWVGRVTTFYAAVPATTPLSSRSVTAPIPRAIPLKIAH